jgi:hypothetical protein
MAGPRAHRLVLPLLLTAVVAFLTSACDGPPRLIPLDLVNPTDVPLDVRVDGKPYPDAEVHWVAPGGTLGVGTMRSTWQRPRRVQAFDDGGEVRFEVSLTGADLDALNWRLVLQGDQRPPSR